MIAVGVDPGASFTGVVVRCRDEILHAVVLDREKLLSAAENRHAVSRRKAWTALVESTVAEALRRTAFDHTLYSDVASALEANAVVLGIEDVFRPHPRGGLVDGRARVIDPQPIIDTAVVLGRLIGAWPLAHLVRPERHGKGLSAAYPESIRPGRRNLGGPSEHARSAWDIAGVAAFLARSRPVAPVEAPGGVL